MPSQLTVAASNLWCSGGHVYPIASVVTGNGWIITGYSTDGYPGSNYQTYLFVSKDNGATWQNFCSISFNSNQPYVSNGLATHGNLLAISTTHIIVLDYTTQANVNISGTTGGYTYSSSYQGTRGIWFNSSGRLFMIQNDGSSNGGAIISYADVVAGGSGAMTYATSSIGYVTSMYYNSLIVNTDGTFYIAGRDGNSNANYLYLVNNVGTLTKSYNYSVITNFGSVAGFSSSGNFHIFLYPGDNTTIYAWCTLTATNVARLIKSTDGGNSWSLVYNGDSVSNLTYYNVNMAIDSTGTFHLFRDQTLSSPAQFCHRTLTGITGTPSVSAEEVLVTGSDIYYQLAVGMPPDGPDRNLKYVVCGWYGATDSTAANYYVATYSVNTAPNVPQPASYSGTPNGTDCNGSTTLTLNWTVSDPDGNNLMQYHLVGSYDNFATWHYDQGVQACNIGSGGNLSINVPIGTFAESNNWSFALQVADSNGAWSGWGYYQYFTLDKTPPTASPDNGGTYDTVASGTHRTYLHSVADNLSGPTGEWYYLVPGGSWSAAQGYGVSGSDRYCDVPKSIQGQYRVDMYLRDNSQNHAASYPYTVYFTVDSVAPYGSITMTTPQYVNTPVGGTFRVSVSGVGDATSGVNRVQFPTWTDLNGQDDLLADWGTNAAASGVNDGSGNYHFDVHIADHSSAEGIYDTDPYVYDNAGNSFGLGRIQTYVDRTPPTVSAPVISAIKAATATATWTVPTDPAPSNGGAASGINTVKITLEAYNGSTWAAVSGFPVTVSNSATSYNFTGLVQNTQYRSSIIATDRASNSSTSSLTTFTTNALPSAAFNNLASAGYMFETKPTLKFTVSDSNGDTLSDFQLQISTVNTFASTTIAATKSGNSAGWASATLASGGIQAYTLQSALTPGTYYARAAVYDGKDWSSWSAVITVVVKDPATAWAETVSNTATGFKKSWVDELRSTTNSLRAQRGMASYTFTDATVTAETTLITATHINEMRTAVSAVATTAGVSLPAWQTTITASVTDRAGQHINELRTACTML